MRCYGGGIKEDDGGREKIGRSYRTRLKYQYKRMGQLFNTASRRRFGCLKMRAFLYVKISSFGALTTQYNQRYRPIIPYKKARPRFDWPETTSPSQ
jgi:hypothetical protein